MTNQAINSTPTNTRENSHVRTHENLIVLNAIVDSLQDFTGYLNTGGESEGVAAPPMPCPSFVEVLVSTPDKLEDINDRLLNAVAKLKDILH